QVSELVQFLLVKDQKKIPIKRPEMLKNVIREYKDAYSEIVNKAGKTLQEVFGLQLVEIDSKRHTYILINNLPRAEGEYLCRAALAPALARLFIPHRRATPAAPNPPQPQGCLVGLGDVLDTPKPAGRTHHPPLCRYLEITSIPLTDPQEFKYQWGPRAEKEISKKDVLNAVAKIQGKDPTFWSSQYSEAVA
ncbi:NSE3 protein, partial [Sylvia borin]|nr:NSE3 protein [Sylvia borin]